MTGLPLYIITAIDCESELVFKYNYNYNALLEMSTSVYQVHWCRPRFRGPSSSLSGRRFAVPDEFGLLCNRNRVVNWLCVIYVHLPVARTCRTDWRAVVHLTILKYVVICEK